MIEKMIWILLLLNKSFHKSNKPILGICAGIQSINVCFGGSLFQDIPNHTSKEETTMHLIKLEKGSFLEKCYGTDMIKVNSSHHQAVNRVADNFKVTTLSEDGIIDAIEYNNIRCTMASRTHEGYGVFQKFH